MNPATVLLSDPSCDGQAQSGAGCSSRIAPAVKAIEDAREICLRDPIAGIGHANLSLSISQRRLDGDLTIRRRVLAGVVDEDQKELL